MKTCTITKQVTVTIPADLVARLGAIALAKDTSLDLVLETAVLTYCEEIEDHMLGGAFPTIANDEVAA